MSQCPFCIENKFPLYRLLFDSNDPEDFTIQQTPNFVVMPDIAPLVEGHLLIISRNHYLCYGSVLNEHYLEFQELKKHVALLLTKTYSSPVFFEHGAAQTSRAGNSIDHAHIHCLPVNIDIALAIRKKISWTIISSITELWDYSAKNIPYLFYENNLDTQYVYALDKESSILPSQYLRMMIAEVLKLKNWNWKEMITDENYKELNRVKVLKTIKRLKKL